MKSLKAQENQLSQAERQIEILENSGLTLFA
jgi:hypothetical protein